ncbi:MAG: hypothetical protein GF398_08945 [Chitinivibrionales bacterium]|nr:hypothetical protein [Chitinivibrionales bacterium]
MSIAMVHAKKFGRRDYAFMCARARSMMASLLPVRDLRQIESYTSLSQIVDFLMDSDYAPVLGRYLKDGQSVNEVERGINAYFFNQVDRMASGFKYTIAQLGPIILSQWECHNTKVVLRAVMREGHARSAGQALAPIGSFAKISRNDLDAVCSVADVCALLLAHNIKTADHLQKGLEIYKSNNDPLVIEREIDKHYYESMQSGSPLLTNSRDSRILKPLVQFLIDIANIRMATRFINQRVPEELAQALYVPGGTLDYRRFLALMQADAIEALYDALKGHPVEPGLQDGMFAFITQKNPSIFERRFDKIEITYKKKLALIHPLSFATPLYFLILARNQMINLRVLVRGIAFQIPLGRLREELIYV